MYGANSKGVLSAKAERAFLSQIIQNEKNSQKNIGREQYHEVHYESSRKKRRENYDDVF